MPGARGGAGKSEDGLDVNGYWCNRFESVAAGEKTIVVASEPGAAGV